MTYEALGFTSAVRRILATKQRAITSSTRKPGTIHSTGKYVWKINPLTKRGYWSRIRSTTAKRLATVSHTPAKPKAANYEAECKATGMPAEMVGPCAALRKQGLSMDKIGPQLEAQYAQKVQQAQAAQLAQQVSPPTTGGMKKYLIIGGVAVGALVLVMVLRRK